VAAFPSYLAAFGIRLEDGDLRRAVLANMVDENGGEDVYGDPAKSHADLWLDFVQGMGGRSRTHQPIPEITELITWFHQVSSEGAPEEAVAAYYAYESQVPRIAREKDRGLRELYGAGEQSRAYFTLHTTADIYHSQVWRKQLEKRIAAHPDAAENALQAAEKTAQALWKALDGVEARRQAMAAA
jgi:pyrroloquinoline-quinone synthase